MLGRLTRWLGDWTIAGIAAWLAWEQVADRLPRWSLYPVLGAVGVCALLTLPVAKNDDGSTRRLINIRVRGHGNVPLVAVSGSRITSNIVNTGKGNQTVHGLPVTLTELRQYTIDVSRSGNNFRKFNKVDQLVARAMLLNNNVEASEVLNKFVQSRKAGIGSIRQSGAMTLLANSSRYATP